VEHCKRRIDDLELKISSTPEHKISDLKHTVEATAQQLRANDVVFYNLAEPDVESRPALRDTMRDLIDPESGSSAPDIKEARRLGFRNNQPAAAGNPPRKPRPVLVTFGSSMDRSKVLKQKSALRAKGINVAPNLTPAQQEAKRHLVPHASMLFNQGKRPYWRDAQLWYSEGGEHHRFLPPPPPRTPAQNGGGGGRSGTGRTSDRNAGREGGHGGSA
jgi:hypothetical protein